MLPTVVTCTILVLVGCSSSPMETGNTPAPSTSVETVDRFDVSRIAGFENDFPPGFISGPTQPIKVQHQWVDSIGTVVSSGKPFTVDPPQCRALLKPVEGEAGADSMYIRGDNVDEQSISVGAVSPVTVAAEIPSAGCERMTYKVDSDAVPTSGTAERISAPTVEGATTIALKVQVNGFPNVEYSYAAILDGRDYVDVQARLAPEFQTGTLLPDLLVKAVDAVRHR
jgi:hypothetical protein